MLISIDPGVKKLGFALFGEDGRLRAAGASLQKETAVSVEATVALHARNINLQSPELGTGDVRAVVERMVWRSGDSKSQPNSLLNVQIVGGALAGLLSNAGVGALAAEEWKGSIPKNVHHPRIGEALSNDEKEILSTALDKTPKKAHSEIYDAIGIGLFALGRIDKAGRRL